MKFGISKKWFGFFAGLGSGLGITAFLANNAGASFHDQLMMGGESLLNIQVEPPPLGVNVIPDGWPWPPIHMLLKNISVTLRNALSDDGVNLFEEHLPHLGSEASATFVWVSGTILTLITLQIAMQFMSDRKILKLENEIELLKEKVRTLSNDDLESITFGGPRTP